MYDKSAPSAETKKKGKLSDDALDGITAVVLIALAVSGVVYWLSTMP